MVMKSIDRFISDSKRRLSYSYLSVLAELVHNDTSSFRILDEDVTVFFDGTSFIYPGRLFDSGFMDKNFNGICQSPSPANSSGSSRRSKMLDYANEAGSVRDYSIQSSWLFHFSTPYYDFLCLSAVYVVIYVSVVGEGSSRL